MNKTANKPDLREEAIKEHNWHVENLAGEHRVPRLSVEATWEEVNRAQHLYDMEAYRREKGLPIDTNLTEIETMWNDEEEQLRKKWKKEDSKPPSYEAVRDAAKRMGLGPKHF